MLAHAGKGSFDFADGSLRDPSAALWMTVREILALADGGGAAKRVDIPEFDVGG
ncbi:MAG: hypothetical protein JWQ87_613 [Candidatus Sulfotelmatobacter sp.]|nr:hypothetical protein [Candidatus Sulfotelmatobacter sp.]